MQPIVIIMAMQDEAQSLMQRFNFKLIDAMSENSGFPMQVYTTSVNEQELILVLPELHPIHNVDCIGTQMATVITWEAIRRFSPQLIINIGTAGGFRARGVTVGDVYLIQDHPIYYHDRNIPLPNFFTYGRGGYRTYPMQIQNPKLAYKDGVLCTGSSFVTLDNPILKEFQVSLVDMEAAAIAEIAERLQIPVVVVKVISDLADCPHSAAEFAQNLLQVCKKIPLAIEEILQNLSIKAGTAANV